MPAPLSPERIRDANVRYHDTAAAGYDSKWGIDFGPVGQSQVRAKLANALGRWPAAPGNGTAAAPFPDALEIGAGTGYFALNLVQLGLVERATATDISRGMLDELEASAARLGVGVTTVRTGAERLPFPDESFDLVFGHAVLHHIPDLELACAEFARVLRPGGTLAFCGEPSRYGDSLAAAPKRVAMTVAPLWRRALGASERARETMTRDADQALEWEVDVHSFAPGELRALLAGAGFTGVRIRGEELVASLYGWLVRTLESTADPSEVPVRWRTFAFRSYMLLRRVDAALLERRLPAELFYNLVLAARKPG